MLDGIPDDMFEKMMQFLPKEGLEQIKSMNKLGQELDSLNTDLDTLCRTGEQIKNKLEKLNNEVTKANLLGMDPDIAKAKLAEMEDLYAQHRGHRMTGMRLMKEYDALRAKYPDFPIPEIPDELRLE